MLAWFMAAFMAATVSSGLEEARDREDRAALQQALNASATAAAKAPNDATAQHQTALAASYLAEIAQIQRDKPLAKQAAEQGIKAGEKAVALKPTAENYRLLGVLYGQAVTDLMSGLSYGPRAKSAISKAVELAPNSAAAYVARGVGNYYVPEALGGGAKVAISDFRKAIQLDPKDAEAYLWLGIALHKQKQDAEARQALTKSLALNPKRLWAKQELDKINPFSANRCSSSLILGSPGWQALQLAIENPEERL
jgi:tetratricopeptide (TPR) repeat protein